MNMQRQVIDFTTEEAWLCERVKDATSTDTPALFGVSPYKTRFELFHEKHRGMPSSFVDNTRARWGRRLEPSIGAGVCEDNGWAGAPFKNYMRLPEHRVGSSFDWKCSDSEGDFLLEIKNLDYLAFKDGWIETDFGIEAPAHIELQCQHEMLVSGIHRLKICAFVGGNDAVILDRVFYPDVGDDILRECAAFWALTEAPAADYYRDGDIIARLNAYAEPDKVVVATERVTQLMIEYRRFQNDEAVARDEKDARKAEILELIGDAEKVTGPDGLSINAGMVAPVEVAAHTRKSYRNCRVNQKRSKA